MVKQIACVLSPLTGNGTPHTNPFRPQFADFMQAGESWASDLAELPVLGNLLAEDGNSLRLEQFPPATRFLGMSVLGVCIVYVEADSARLDTADAAAAYHVFWRWTTNRAEKPSGDTEKSPLKFPVNAELTALRDYLVLQTGKSAGTISTWLANHFGVTPAQMAAWATARPRYMTITKLGQAFQDWNAAKSQLDTIGA